MGKKWTWRLVPLFAVLALMLSGCQGALNPQGTNAKDQFWLIQLAFYIMILVLLVVFVLFFYAIIRYRKRKGQTGYPKQVEGNHKLEVIWTVVPFLLLMILAVPMIMLTFTLAKDTSKDKDAIHVKVTAHQFWWQFEYPDLKINTGNDLVIPAGKTISLEIVSADVAHSFWVPQLTGKMDAIPGITNKMYFTADKPGVYKGKCAELCGASHALMDFKVVVKSEADFTAWADHLKQPAVLAADAKQGEEIFKNKCIQCHAVDPGQPGLGPNLAGFGSRETVAGFRPRTDEWISKWLKDPQAVKPGTLMPNVGLTDSEVTSLVKYLQEQK